MAADSGADLAPRAAARRRSQSLPRPLADRVAAPGRRRRVVCSARHDPRRAPHARAPARPRPLRAQYPEDGRPREGRRQEAPPPCQDPQVPGDRPPPGRGRRGRRLRGQGGRGRGDGRAPACAISSSPPRWWGPRRSAGSSACSAASPRRWSWSTIPTTCASWGGGDGAAASCSTCWWTWTCCGRRTGCQPGEPALALGRAVCAQPALNLRGLQGYAGHCAHVMGWEERRRTSRRCDGPAHEDARALREARPARGRS